MPDPQRLLNTLRLATDSFRRTQGRQGRIIDLSAAEDVVVVGDLHGHVINFKKAMDFADLNQHPRRHLVVQELIHGPVMYPNGGEQSHRVVDLLAALKCLHPHRVHYLLGNHELSQWTRQAISKNFIDLNDLFRLGVEAAYDQYADAIYQAYEALFAALPVIIRLPNGVILSHSVPGAKRIADWSLEALAKDKHDEQDVILGGCIHAVVWGRDVSSDTVQAFLDKTGGRWLISGHIPCDQGYDLPNPKQIIIDSKDDHGCMLTVPAQTEVTQAELVSRLVRFKQIPD